MLCVFLGLVAILASVDAACDNGNVYPGQPCCTGTAVNAKCTRSVYGYAGYCKAAANSSGPHTCTLCNQKDGICCPGSAFGALCYASNGYCFSANTAATGPALTCKQCNSPNPPTPCCPGTQIGGLCHGVFGGPPGFPTCGGGACGVCTAPAKGAISSTNPAMCMPCGGKGQPQCPECAPLYGQCGGKTYVGPTCCQGGLNCVPQRGKDGKINEYFSQCLP